MSDQSGGQTPAGWYPDGSGQLRYWDGAAWTEHVQPDPAAAAAPQAPATPPAPAEPATTTPPLTVGESAAAGAAGAGIPATAGATPVAAGYPAQTRAVTPEATPFYKKPLILAAIVVALIVIIGGAALALGGGSSDGSNPTGMAPATAQTSAAPAATTATQTYSLNCEPHGMIQGSNTKYPFDITMTVTPTAITVSSKGSIKNTGPTIIEAGAYRFEAAVTVNGTPLQLIGPTNKTKATGTTEKNEQPIFKDAEEPLVATAPNPVTTGTPTVVLNDIYFNQITGSGTDITTDIFDARCNSSAQPNSAPAPIGLSVPPAAGGSAASVAPSVASSVAPSVASSVAP